MRKIVVVIVVFFFINEAMCLEKNLSSDHDIKLLDDNDFKKAVKNEFNSLLGQYNGSLANSIASTFNNKESILSTKFTIPAFDNDSGFYTVYPSIGIKLGENAPLYEFGNSDMLVFGLNFSVNWLLSATWNYDSVNKKKVSDDKAVYSIRKNKKIDSTNIDQYYLFNYQEDSANVIYHKKTYFWINLSGSYNGNEYKLYDYDLGSINEVTKENSSASIGLNILNIFDKNDGPYKSKLLVPFFIFHSVNFGYNFGFINNLETIEIIRDIKSENDIKNQEVRLTEKAFTGTIKRSKYWSLDYEALYGIDKHIAINFGLNSRFSQEMNPSFQFFIGPYFIINDEKGEPVVNLGITYNKMLNNKPTIELKTSIPIIFI